MNDMLELKPCPFCGGDASLIGDHRGEDVSCENNDCLINPGTAEFYNTCEEAINASNTRAQHKDNDLLMSSDVLLNEIAMRDVIVSSVKFLLELKTHKMLHGKDEHYLENIEVTWFELDEAIQALQDGVNLTELYGGKI